MGLWGGAHAAVAAGVTVLAWEAIIPGSMLCVMNPECQQRVFWSGDGMKAAAEQWVNNYGGTTLGQTDVGIHLSKATQGMDWLTQAKPLWAAASSDFAGGAEGVVHAFLNSPSANSIWNTIEYPILNAKEALGLVHIIYH